MGGVEGEEGEPREGGGSPISSTPGCAPCSPARPEVAPIPRPETPGSSPKRLSPGTPPT